MAAANSPDRFELVRRWDRERNQRGWWHSFELPDGTRIEGVCGLDGLKNRIAQFPISQDLRGKRVLDIGAWDGWFSFEMERRGAEVLAIDNWDNPRFREMQARLNSRIDYRQMDMYDLTPQRIGRFDIVLFMGVLYHLKHPLLALERVCALTTELAAVDSFILREHHRPGERVEERPVMEFYETAEFGGQTDNWVAPSLPCLMAFCRTAGFARVNLCGVLENSACIACYRRWEPPPLSAAPGPELVAVTHNINGGINFDSAHDQLVSAWFRSPAPTLSLDDIRPEVGDFGVRPLHAARIADGEWQINFKLPPGLPPGWHDVRVRAGSSLPGSAQRVAVDLPLEAAGIQIRGVSDGATWAKDQLDLSRGDVLSIWIAGLPENADRNNLRVELATQRLPVIYIEPPAGAARQVNVQVSADLPVGLHFLSAAVGDARAAHQIEIVRT